MDSDAPLDMSLSENPRAPLDKASSSKPRFDSKEREHAIRALVRMSKVRYKLASIKDPTIDIATLDRYLFHGITYLSKGFRYGTVTMLFEHSVYHDEIHGILESLANMWGYLTGPEKALDECDVDGLRQRDILTEFFMAHLKYTFRWVRL